jgi:hypothetical protein
MSQGDTIKVGRAIPGPGIKTLVSEQIFDYSALLGSKATLLGCGENIILDAVLPVTGTLQRQIQLQNWGSDWLVLQFEQSICYENDDPVSVSHTPRYCYVNGVWRE